MAIGELDQNDRVAAAPRVLFLPGARGDPGFWRPVCEQLPRGWHLVRVGWPGAGEQPHDASVRGFDDLVELVAGELEMGSDVVAQSMGGVVALGLALRHPDRLRRLVLVATSGGLNTGELGAEDWRSQYRREYPRAASWVTEEHVDHSDALTRIAAPTLLLWGARDSVSPVAVGQRLRQRLPNAELHVFGDGTHSLAHDQPVTVAALIAAHLR